MTGLPNRLRTEAHTFPLSVTFTDGPGRYLPDESASSFSQGRQGSDVSNRKELSRAWDALCAAIFPGTENPSHLTTAQGASLRYGGEFQERGRPYQLAIDAPLPAETELNTFSAVCYVVKADSSELTELMADIHRLEQKLRSRYSNDEAALGRSSSVTLMRDTAQIGTEKEDALHNFVVSYNMPRNFVVTGDELDTASLGTGEQDSVAYSPEVRFLPEDECGVSFDRKADPRGKNTFSDLYGMVRKIRSRREQAGGEDWGGLIDRFQEIADSGKSEPFSGMGERADDGEPKDHWYGVHMLVCDLLGKALAINDGVSRRLALGHTPAIIDILWYMLGYAYRDPSLRDSGASTGKGNEMDAGQFAGVSRSLRSGILKTVWGLMVRGDGLARGELDRVRTEIKNLFRTFVKMESHHLNMFLVGQLFPSFYRRDRKFGHEMLPLVFPEEKEKESLYVAAWTGYLVRTPSEKILDDPKIVGLYRRGLALDAKVNEPYFPRFHDDYMAGIAKHLAFAHLRFEKFDIESDLVSRFLRKGDSTQFASFIDCVGREITFADPRYFDRMRLRLPRTWEWFLSNYKTPKTFEHFGTWINAGSGLFDTAELARLTLKTLKETKGKLEWKHGLAESMASFEECAPEMARDIRLQLDSGGATGMGESPPRRAADSGARGNPAGPARSRRS